MGIGKPKRHFPLMMAQLSSGGLSSQWPIFGSIDKSRILPNDEGEGEADPEMVREMLEDALVLLDNANARLNVWRQRRFSDYLTRLGRRTLREGIPSDRHLFPHQFYEKIKSERDHKASSSKLFCNPKAGPKPWSRSQSFRDSASLNGDSSPKQTGKGNGPTRLQAPVLSIQQTTPTVADYLLPRATLGQSNGKQNRNFFNKLRLAHNGQMDSSGCVRVQNTFPQTPASVAYSSHSCPGRTAD